MRKVWIAAFAASFLLAAGALALSLRQPVSAPQQAAEAVSGVVESESDDPVTRFRTEREQLRARETAQLNEVIHSGNTDSETMLMAQRQLLDLMRRTEQELTIEGVLQARGYEDALVTVGPDSVNVLFRTGTVTQAQSAVILDLVTRETGVLGGNVKIIPIN